MKGQLLKVGQKLKGKALRAGAKVSKRSPEILMIAGGITFIATVVVACRQTLKCEEVLDKHQRAIDDIENCIELAEEEPEKVEYTLEDAKRDRFIAYCHTGLGFAKVYAPVVVLGIVSLTCFGCSFNIMRKRNLALTAAYTALDTAFKGYRKRVVDELGEESDKYFRYGYKKVKNALVAGKDADGNDIAVVADEIDEVPWNEPGDGMLDDATFIFAPETTKYWGVDELHNDMTIASALNVAKVDYQMKGYMFLNEVLRNLGMKEIPYGQLVGWIKGKGDDYIDFKIDKIHRKASSNPNRNPLGLTHETIYQIRFNTCGTIWDRI